MQKITIILSLTLPLAGFTQQWEGSTLSTGDIYRYGEVGIDRTIAPPVPFDPQTILHVKTHWLNDGIRVEQTGGSGATIGLYNSGAGGHQYRIFSTGPANFEGAGHFGVYDNSGGWKMFMHSTTGNVGFGTGSATPTARLQGRTNINSVSGVFTAGLFEANLSVEGAPVGVKGIATNLVGAVQNFSRGVWGVAETPNISGNLSSYNHGVHGTATGGHYNVGGHFEATTSGPARTAIGIYTTYSVSGGSSGWAAYFNGNTFCTGAYTTSDQRLKTSIRPLTNALDKVLLLKPSAYTYKTGEFPLFNLPEGEQTGLIAQDLEAVFPEMVRDVPGFDQFDESGKVTGSLPAFKAVNYTALIPVLIAAIQEQQQQIDEQQAVIAALKQQLPEAGFNAGIVVNQVRLYQNEPNPFNRETTIGYYVPEQIEKASIAIYDLTGKQLLAVPLIEKGNGSIVIASGSLSVGMFVYAIIADNKLIDSKRMVITD